jgi:hypothetical protein
VHGRNNGDLELGATLCDLEVRLGKIVWHKVSEDPLFLRVATTLSLTPLAIFLNEFHREIDLERLPGCKFSQFLAEMHRFVRMIFCHPRPVGGAGAAAPDVVVAHPAAKARALS